MFVLFGNTPVDEWVHPPENVNLKAVSASLGSFKLKECVVALPPTKG